VAAHAVAGRRRDRHAASVQQSAGDAARRGFSDALQIALLVELAGLVLAFGLAFTLPLRARPE
jgi:hypothetical protein